VPRSRDDREQYGEPHRRGEAGSGISAPVLIGCLLVGLMVLAGGGVAVWYWLGRGESTTAVTEKYRPRFAQQRGKLKRIAASLPAPGSVQNDRLPANLDPKPVYDVPNKTFNTAILMAAQCEDPDRNLKTPGEFDLSFHEDEFRTHLLWTGDKSPMAESARKSPAKDLAQRFDRSLDLRYLIVMRPERYNPPRVVNDSNFAGGEVELEVFLFDYQSEKLLGEFSREYRPDQQVMVEFRKDRKEQESAEAFIYSSVWSKAREDIVGILRSKTGGTFDINARR
jgi:hypothetical protein